MHWSSSPTLDPLLTLVFRVGDGSAARLLKLMVDEDAPALTVVGDDDQCIYAFRGACPGNFGRLREEYGDSLRALTVELLC